MDTITRSQLKTKIDTKADIYLIEVLDQDDFESFHIPGAINIPLRSENFEEQVEKAVPDKEQEIIVYCKDMKCGASPEAAKKLEALGYNNVKDYQAGKVDWKAAGYPVEVGIH